MEKVVIDTDTGVDDAQAIMLALSRPDVEVLAITCVAGNCNVEQVCRNTLKVLTVCKRLDIQVYKGSSKALVGKGLTATYFHGNDGLGDANLDIAVDLDQIQKGHAVNALVEFANTYPGQITLVALAPLTNIALALKQDHDFGKKLKKVVIMGGNMEGKGNVSLSAEFNFASDPEAAKCVLAELQTIIILLPWEAKNVGQSWEWFDEWIETDTTKGRFNKAITMHSANLLRHGWKLPTFISCDMNAMACYVDPRVIQDNVDVYATVELNGTYTRGMLVVDWGHSLQRKPNVTLVRGIDAQKARLLYEYMLK